MSLTPPASLEESDFETIEDAVLETARGRWFLREFARRVRAVETSGLMDALERIERALSGREQASEAVSFDVEHHASGLEERHGRLSEIAWVLRERGYDGDICAMIEKEARAVGRLARTLRGGRAAEPARLESPRAASVDSSAMIEEPPLEALPMPLALTMPEPPVKPAPVLDWRVAAAAAFAPIDMMSTRERMALCA